MNKTLSILLFIIILTTSVSALSTTATVNWDSEIGQIRSDFYGVSDDSLWFGGTTIDRNNDGTRETWSNRTWHREKLIESNVNKIRFDAGLGGYYSNKTGGDGVNFTNAGNITMPNHEVKFAYENGLKALIIIDYMPTWLADNSSGFCTNLAYCPASNYTKWNNIVIDYINRTTNNGTFINTIEVSIWNEPDGNFWMGGLSLDNITKATNYAILYNNTYWAIKNAYPNVKINGPSLSSNSYGINSILLDTFLSNFTNQFDSIEIHKYSKNIPYDDLEILYTNITTHCNNYNANCSNIIYGEWNVYNSSIHNNTNLWNQYTSYVSSGYQFLLTKPQNITSIFFDWSEPYIYGSRSQNYPYDWKMVSEPLMNNTIHPAYNITKLFATNHKAGNTVVTSSTSASTVKIVASKDSAGKKYITLTNTNTSAFNVSITGLSENTQFIDNETGTKYYAKSGTMTIPNLQSYSVLFLQSEPIVLTVNYTVSYSNNAINEYNQNSINILTYITSMIVNFFSMLPTTGTILAISILIMGIIILIVYVIKMNNKNEFLG